MMGLLEPVVEEPPVEELVVVPAVPEVVVPEPEVVAVPELPVLDDEEAELLQPEAAPSMSRQISPSCRRSGPIKSLTFTYLHLTPRVLKQKHFSATRCLPVTRTQLGSVPIEGHGSNASSRKGNGAKEGSSRRDLTTRSVRHPDKLAATGRFAPRFRGRLTGDAARGGDPIRCFRNWAFGMGGVLCLAGNGSSALCEEAPSPLVGIALQYRVPAEERCPSAEWFVEQVRGRVRYDPFGEPKEQELLVVFERDDHGLSCQISLRRLNAEGAGKQSLRAEHGDCPGLASAAVLAAAIAIDPLVASGTPSGEVAPIEPPKVEETKIEEAKTETPAESPPAVEVRSVQEPVAVPAATWPIVEGGLAGGTSLGAQPVVAVVGTVLVGVRWRRLALGLEGYAQLPVATTLQNGAVSTHQEGVTLVPCWTPDRWSVCGLLSVGFLGASASGTAAPTSGTTTLLATGPRIAWDTGSRSDVRVRLEGDLMVPIVRGEVVLGGNLVWRAPLVSSALSVALVVPLFR
jgi:hypothetical protein